MDIFENNTALVLMSLGILTIIVEILVLGFSVFILFFIGISLLLTGLAVYLGLLPDSWLILLFSNAILTGLLSLILWKPLKKLQDNKIATEVTSDFHGHRFTLDQSINKHSDGRYQYSGITWKIKSDIEIPAGTEVEICAVEVGCFWVKPVYDNLPK